MVKTSASGPMPTSRYWLQRPSPCSAALAAAAASLPGWMSRRLAPISPAMRARTASALAGSPAARSSITRSTIERAKVTPQALSACRSQGAMSRRPSPASAARAIASSGPSARPSASPASRPDRRAPGGRAPSPLPAAVTSTTAPSRSVTTQGPRSGSRTRPAQTPPASSRCGSGSLTPPLPRSATRAPSPGSLAVPGRWPPGRRAKILRRPSGATPAAARPRRSGHADRDGRRPISQGEGGLPVRAGQPVAHPVRRRPGEIERRGPDMGWRRAWRSPSASAGCSARCGTRPRESSGRRGRASAASARGWSRRPTGPARGR